ncbi:1-phosphatidylinositol phosphodiesterase-like [Glandiceps talaboti]
MGINGSSTRATSYSSSKWPKVVHPNWMSNLSDDLSVAKLSIPGTHDTMSFYGGASTQCQTWPLKKQLEAGVRFLDIRCRHYHNQLPIHHGMFYQHAHFRDVLKDVLAFLDDHRSETVLMRVKKEHTDKGNTEEFATSIKLQLKEYFGDTCSRIWNENKIPKLGEVRGKVVVLKEYHGDFPKGIQYSCHSTNQLVVADKYNVPTLFHLNSKWEHVKNALTVALQSKEQKIHLTFSSAAGIGAYPDIIALRINPKLLNLLQSQEIQVNPRHWGMIAIDFPGEDLIQEIIYSNKTFKDENT